MDFSDGKAPDSGSQLNDAQPQALAEIAEEDLIPAIYTGWCAGG